MYWTPLQHALDPLRDALDPLQHAHHPLHHALDPLQDARDFLQDALDPLLVAVDPIQYVLQPPQDALDPLQVALDNIQYALDHLRDALYMVDELHEGHPGIAKMKALARQDVWWPGLDGDLDERVKQCTPCQEYRKNPPAAPPHPWEWPEQLWRRVHADYAGPYLGHLFLILIDAHSKWMEVHMMRSSTSLVTIEKMRSSFAALGLPEQLVNDNGPSFTSGEFRHGQFMRNNGVHHITTSPCIHHQMD